MSSHAPRNKLLNLIKTFPYTKSIIINHGDEETKRKFREYLLDNLDLPEDEIPLVYYIHICEVISHQGLD